jgi:hypothetical protein
MTLVCAWSNTGIRNENLNPTLRIAGKNPSDEKVKQTPIRSEVLGRLRTVSTIAQVLVILSITT